MNWLAGKAIDWAFKKEKILDTKEKILKLWREVEKEDNKSGREWTQGLSYVTRQLDWAYKNGATVKINVEKGVTSRDVWTVIEPYNK